MSITQLADECGTAEATVSRFCRKLKLKGFNAFKLELAMLTASGSPAQQTHTVDSPEGRRAEVGRQSIDAINQTLELANPREIQRAIEILESAPHVMCIGAGGSMIMARECAHMFSTVTPNFYAVADSHSQTQAAATMGQEDVIILFSYSGATVCGIDILDLAKSRGIRTILITRFRKSPAAKLADVVLCCGANESPFQFGSIPAKIAQLIVIDILFQEFCHRNPELCEKNIQRIADALSGKHL
jgi:DNA-binding MurR/RpiR family transcriptional regulator